MIEQQNKVSAALHEAQGIGRGASSYATSASPRQKNKKQLPQRDETQSNNSSRCELLQQVAQSNEKGEGVPDLITGSGPGAIITVSRIGASERGMHLIGSPRCVNDYQHEQQQVPLNHVQGDSSSNYEASIFEDDDDVSSYEKDQDSDRLSRRSVGIATVQEHGVSATIIATQSQDDGDGQLVSEQVEEAKKVPKVVKKDELMPLIKSGVSIAADLKFGWRPVEKELHGAPIPLHYDNEMFEIPKDPVTNQKYLVQYFGPRIQTSHDVHKRFANLENLTLDQCPDPRPNIIGNKTARGVGPLEPYPTYSFKFPLRMPIMAKHVFDDPLPFVGMNPKLAGQLDDDLIFDSAFESGNLDMVIKTQPMNYDLYMRVDTNTRGHHQWFYFSTIIPPSLAGKTVKFRVVNFTKPMSLYTSGMRICVARKSQNYQWMKNGKNIQYGKSHLVRRPSQDPSRVIYYSTLSFDFDLTKTKESEKIFFAYCFPYTFTHLTQFLRSLNFVHKDSEIFKESVLCKSLSGVDVPLVTISSRMKSDPKNYNQIKLSEFEDDDSKLSLPMYKKKKYAIICARVHPGESNSSYMMQGFIKYLLGDSHQAKQLRKRVVFKIVPMINVDGVIIGNYRTSMSGNDLNRRYIKPDFRIHPAVCAIKQIASDLIYGPDEESKKDAGEPETINEDIMAFIDMHGHSRKKNVFVYGPQEPLHTANYLKMRIIPKLIAEETQKFRYHSCRFRLEQSKLKAARIVMWREFNITNCFTFEASFHGHFDHLNNNFEFTCAQYEEMGEHLGNSFFEYLMIIEEEERRRKLLEIAKKKKKKQKLLAMQPAGNFSNFTCAPTAVGSAGSSKDVHQNQPPSGKSGKKGGAAAIVGSSSSRARNVSHVTNKDYDKEPQTATAIRETRKAKKSETRVKEKTKRKGLLLKSDTPSSMAVANHPQQARSEVLSRQGVSNIVNQAQASTAVPENNPNEPPNEVPDQDQQAKMASNIQVGSHDLREIQRFANTHLNSYNQEQQLVAESAQPKRRLGFRNLKDMFGAIRAQEKELPAACDESDARSDTTDEATQGPTAAAEGNVEKNDSAATGTNARGEEEVEDELSDEQQRKLHGDILNVITQFVKVNNVKEHEYYGVSEQTLKKQKKLRQAENAAAADEAKKKADKAESSAVKEGKPAKTKKEKGRLKRHSHQKESIQASSGVNYQSKTLSVAQKRRSFNAPPEAQALPSKQVITNEQLNQQMQHMAGNRRGGLSSPLYYNLYQSTSNFSNFYIYRFDEKSNAFGALQYAGINPNASQQHYLSLDGNQMMCDPPPGRSQKQQFNAAQQLLQNQQQLQQQQQQQQPQLSGNTSQAYQSKETGRIYHINKGAASQESREQSSANSGRGYNHQQILQTGPITKQVGSSTAGPPASLAGPFGQKRNGAPREAVQVDSMSSIYAAREQLQQQQLLQEQLQQQYQLAQQNDAGGSNAINEFTQQLEHMRHSQQPQAVQPMIFNFFNAKSGLKQRVQNRNQRQAQQQNVLLGSTYQANATVQARSTDSTALSRNKQNIVQPHQPRKPPSIPPPQPSRSLLDQNFDLAVTSLAANGSNQAYQTSGTQVISSTNTPPTVNERYPNQSGAGTSTGMCASSLFRHRTNGGAVANSQQSSGGQQSQAATTNTRQIANKSGVSQKSRSSFQNRKHQPTASTVSKDKDGAGPNPTDDEMLLQSSYDLRNAKHTTMPLVVSTTNGASATMSEKLTKSAKFGKIVAAAEIMLNQSQQGEQPSANNVEEVIVGLSNTSHFQTLPKKHHQIPQLPPATGANSTRLVLNSMHSTLVSANLNPNGLNTGDGPTVEKLPSATQGSNFSAATDVALLQASEIKRNAIRKIHLLNTFNGSANSNSNKKSTLTAQNQKSSMKQHEFELVEPLSAATADNASLHRLHVHASSNAAILRDHLPHQMRAGSLTKKSTSTMVGQLQPQQQPPATSAYPDERIDSTMPSIGYMLKLPRTSAGKPVQLLNQQMIDAGVRAQQIINQDFSVPSDNNNLPSFQLSTKNNDYAAHDTASGLKRHADGQPPYAQYKSGVPIAAEPRRKLSQFNDSVEHENNNGGTSSSAGYYRKDPSYLVNDHGSPLQRSGDYQTKTMKHLQMEAANKASTFAANVEGSNGKKPSSLDIVNVSQQEQAPSSSGKAAVRMRPPQKQSFGQRVPPELYQKNPYYTSSGAIDVNRNYKPLVHTQRVGQLQAQGKSELVGTSTHKKASGTYDGTNCGDSGDFLNSNTNGAASLAVIEANNFALLKEEMKSLGSPLNGAHLASYNPGVHTDVKANMSFWPADVQIPNQFQHAKNEPLLVHSKTMVSGQAPYPSKQQQPPSGVGLQPTLLQGVTQMLDPQYGIVSNEQVALAQSKPKKVSRRLNSPRGEVAKVEFVDQTRKGSRDFVATLFNKTNSENRSLGERSSDQNNYSIQDQQVPSLTSSAQHAIASGAIIRVQKAKYAGLIKQRGTAITVDTPEQINNDVMLASQMQIQGDRNSPRLSPRFENRFSSPQQQAQLQHMHFMAGHYSGQQQQLLQKRIGPKNSTHNVLAAAMAAPSEELASSSKNQSQSVIIGLESSGLVSTTYNQPSSQQSKQFSISSKQQKQLPAAAQISNDNSELPAQQPLSNSSTVKARSNRGYVQAQKRVNSTTRKQVGSGTTINLTGSGGGLQGRIVGSPQASMKVIRGGGDVNGSQVDGPAPQLTILSSNQQPVQVPADHAGAQVQSSSKRRHVSQTEAASSVRRQKNNEVRSQASAAQHNTTSKKQAGAGTRNRGRSSVKASKVGSLQRMALGGESDQSNM